MQQGALLMLLSAFSFSAMTVLVKLAGVFLGEAIRRRLFAAACSSLFGVILVARPTILFGAGTQSLDPLWVSVAVSGAALGAAGRKIRTSMSPDPPILLDVPIRPA